ncbi:hypothetical protein C1646_740598 [Rhizophagus diaphanus]|nr:hypothetical protein C1646_740598 [Rhizophagus diaphanus] [Rhizophagus sp. MUCL 43196]
MPSKFFAELSSDYEKLFETEIGYDVIIHAGEGQNVKEIHAHSSILCIRSQYFRSAFTNEWAQKRNGKFIFKKPNISPQLFDIILRFIYCGNIELKNLQGPDVLKLLIAVDELNIHPLISHIQEFLIEHQTEFLHQNPTGILEIVYHHEAFTGLWNFYLEKICEEPNILFNSDKFINLKASLLELLLKRDDLNADEIEIWENLLKWGISRKNMNYDPTKWSNDDIIKIKKELHKFIPLIHFYDIEPTDFFYKVYRYKEILPQDLIHDLLEFYIVPDMKPKINLKRSRKQNFIDSILIKSSHIPLFASWIDKKGTGYNKNRIPYDFNLLYRSNRDGVGTDSFHRHCDNKGATIWVAKIKNSTQLIGGYNPLDWSGNSWKATTSSFIFNFSDGKNISTAEIGYVTSTTCAVFCHNTYGPTMGNLHCDNNYWSYNGGYYYPKLTIPKSFVIESYEVFQIIER